MNTNNEIIVNVEMIGHFYNNTEIIGGKEKGFTTICLLTNNNGGMKVKESIYQILELIKNKETILTNK
jgi:mannose/fructose-specific phosphotransferase system component IIA